MKLEKLTVPPIVNCREILLKDLVAMENVVIEFLAFELTNLSFL